MGCMNADTEEGATNTCCGRVNTHDRIVAEDIHRVALSHEAVVPTETLGVGIANEDSLHSVYIHGSCDNFVHELKSI